MAHEATSTVGGLVRSAIDDVRELFREEFALAKAEVREELSKLAAGGAKLGVAGVSLGFAAMFMLTAAALGLSQAFAWPAWAGFGVVGLLLAAVGAVAASSARRSLRELRTLPRTVGTIKETFQ